jgi:hypothetical protein
VGFLARDLNRDGVIDSGRELFGTSTRMNDGTLAPKLTALSLFASLM